MSFDSLAPHYRWMEAMLAAGKLQHCRCTHLNKIPGNEIQDVLLAGEGPGRFLEIALKHLPKAQFMVADASLSMLRQAAKSVARLESSKNRTSFVQRDLLEWTPPAESFDLVGTFFTLDCFQPDQLARMIPRLAASLRSGGHWLISDFSIPPHGWWRSRARTIHALMYAFFRHATSLPAQRWTDPDDLLLNSGLTLVSRETTDRGLLRADLWKRG